MPETIQCSGIDPIDALVESGMNRRHGVAVILWTHASVPSPTADGPGADSDRRNVKIAIAELSGFHAGPQRLIFRYDLQTMTCAKRKLTRHVRYGPKLRSPSYNFLPCERQRNRLLGRPGTQTNTRQKALDMGFHWEL